MEAAALETAKKQLMTPIGKETPKVKSEHLSDDDEFAEGDSCCGETSHSSQAARTGKQRRKGQRRWGKLRLRDIHDAGPARLRDLVRRFPPNQSGWPMFFAVMSSFFHGNRVHKICQRGDRHSSFPSQLQVASDPDASQPARPIVRAVTATKHEPGLSPSYRVVSYGAAMEV